MRSLLPRVFPARFFFADDQLTYSARRLLFRTATGTGALALLIVAVVLLDKSITNEVAAGACFAWGVALAIWSFTSYRKGAEEVRASLVETARYDVLHDRLNDLARAVGAEELDPVSGLPQAVALKMERAAPLSGLEEFR